MIGAGSTAELLARGSSEWVGPGLLGLGVIVALCVVVVLLWRNMNKQLGRIRFKEDNDDSDAPS